ncbi:hypothetical protein [Nonomuraea wenchangensis]|uniref:Uncharacterized protein n=1 Tax=Nonomuraea wenchangensis TaxID=568860 RepID=A0A1I0EVU9_9ACTN|nr:hypothetical protein [Nonomuraea wenchangensis]SET49561.1 hypothetical protein SAMN05421811_103222 [Nonomuraea wenchangensis]
MSTLPAAHLHEVAAWMQRWQPDRQVVADTGRSRIVAEVAGAVVVYEADAVRRLIPKRR